MRNKKSQVGSLIETQSNTKKRHEQIDGSVMSGKARRKGSWVYINPKNDREDSRVKCCHSDNSDKKKQPKYWR